MPPSSDKPGNQPAWRWEAIGLVALALAVRGVVVALAPDSLDNDPDGYRYLAENLLHRGIFGYGQVSSAYRPPLYPLLLTPCVALGPLAVVAMAVLHVALGVATVWLVYRLGRRWGLGGYALAAAALVACDPILLMQSTQVMTETPATFLAAVSLLLLTSASERPSTWRAMLAGGCLALTALCRATFLPFMILAALALPMFAQGSRERLRVFGSFAAAAALVLSPWAMRNQIHFGRPIVATTHGGYTLLLGNNPSFYQYLRTGAWGTVWDADEFNRTWRAQATRTRPADEIRNDRLAYAQAWQTIRQEPGTFVYSCAVRAGRLWAPLPHRVDPSEAPAKQCLRYLVGLWYLVELALAVIGLVALSRGARQGETWRATWLWGILLAACFTAIHALYWSNVRMRAPLMPVVALAASAGAASIGARLLGRKSLSENSLRP
jgi:4-amino-4-deoxy-L-arabinose transferase-like glycosyltransferase